MTTIIDKISTRINELNEIIDREHISYNDKDDIEKMKVLDERRKIRDLLDAINFFIRVKMKPMEFEDSISDIATEIDNDPTLCPLEPLVIHMEALKEENYNIVSKQEVYKYIDEMVDQKLEEKTNKK